MPSALAALGIDVPPGLDGTSFARPLPGPRSSLPIDAHLARERADGERGSESAVA
jgi:hypothetical protein